MDPGTAAIATLSTITGIAGYGAMKTNSMQRDVQSLLKATEDAKTIAENQLKSKQEEVEKLKKELNAIRTAKQQIHKPLPPITPFNPVLPKKQFSEPSEKVDFKPEFAQMLKQAREETKKEVKTIGGLMRKKKLRTRRGGKQKNVRRTRHR
jgi:predicted nuclease with TOPRIM domain